MRDNLVTKEDIKILQSQDISTLAKWWCRLNRWEWPDKLPDPEDPKEYGNGRRRELRNCIKTHIGTKECSREWNKNRMSPEEFEAWWEKEGF